MRAPDLEKDRWCLDDGEELHREFPSTFWIPDLEIRRALRPGDFAKLVFRIAVAGNEEGERMWVIVRSRIQGGYVGMLNNAPSTIAENDELWVGTELPFEYRHIISVRPGNEESRALAAAPVPIPWDRS